MRSRHSTARALVLAFLVASSAACDDDYLRRGEISDVVDTLTVTIPAVFQVNVPSTVTVHTYRGSCVEFGRTDAEVIGLTATIEPYDWVRGTLCTGPLSTIAHPVQLVFAQPGTATLRFVGLDWRDSVVTIERSAPVTN